MTARECSREVEVAQTMRRGHWPQVCAEELRQHVGGCRRCGELVRVKMALTGMRARDAAAARLESPGLLLWRAQMRRRNAALEQVSRPMQRASIFGLAVLAAVLLGLGALGLRAGAEWDAASLLAARQGGGTLVVWGMVGAAALLGGVVAFFAAERE